MDTLLMQLCGLATSIAADVPPETYAAAGPSYPFRAELIAEPIPKLVVIIGQEDFLRLDWDPPSWITGDPCVEQARDATILFR
jgi:hypothetical protein